MDLGINGKKALVTGASQGIGLAVAKGLAAEGVNLAMCARSKERLNSSATQIEQKTGRKTVALPGNLAKEGFPANLVVKATKVLGGLDILVTNAGAPPFGGFGNWAEKDWREAFELNCLASMMLMKEALPIMRHQGWGRIINIVSRSVKEPVELLVLSGGVRACLVNATKAVSREVFKDGVTINNVGMGWTKTQTVLNHIRAKATQTGQTEDQVEYEYTTDLPRRCMNSPKEIADLIVFLSSERGGAISGNFITVDGGLSHSMY
jgi:3-oxoacyl-[acyl-carrier protein] reductase